MVTRTSCAALRLKILQIAAFESGAAVGICEALVASRLRLRGCSPTFLPLAGSYNLEFLNHRLFKSTAAPAGQMKVVIFFSSLRNSSLFVHYMSLQGAASSYLCPVTGYMCTEGTNLCGRRIRTKEATDLRSVGLQASAGTWQAGILCWPCRRVSLTLGFTWTRRDAFLARVRHVDWSPSTNSTRSCAATQQASLFEY